MLSTARRRGVVLVGHVFAQGNVFPLLGDDALAGIVALVDRLAALRPQGRTLVRKLFDQLIV